MISSGTDFLRLQAGSNGFRSVVQGPPEFIGSFDLTEINETAGTARVHSTTVFPLELERGILMGGLGLAGDLLFYDVGRPFSSGCFDILFVTGHNRTTLSWHEDVLEEIEWRFRQQQNQGAERERFLQSINETLNAAYAEMRKALSRLKVLGGMLPICASCKKIGDDRGYWNQIEAYIRDHSEAEFSHSICPECAKRLYPEFGQT